MDLVLNGIDPMLAAYALAFSGPFIQEDAAVIGSAGVAAMDARGGGALLAACLAGLVVSDLWKYGAGAAAHRTPFLARFAARPEAAAARAAVVRHMGLAILAARFTPGARVALYLACGVARAPFAKFAVMIVVSAIVYLAIAYAVARGIGAFGAPGVIALAAPVLGVAAVAAWLRFKPRAQTQA